MSEHNCHDCEHMHDCEETDNIIELIGENGDTINVVFLASIKMDDKEYAIMHALDNEAEDGEVIIMRMENDGGDDYLMSIDDEDELDRVFEAFKKAASEEYEFEDYEPEDDFDEDFDEEDDPESGNIH